MTGMHHMLVHFPLAFWALALLMMVAGRLGRGSLAKASAGGLLAVLVLSLLGAVAALISGWLVWPVAANLNSPMVRNHLLMSIWATGLWTVITLLVWQAGRQAVQGARGTVLIVLGLVGAALFAISGTLGGYLAGAPTQLSALLAQLGWSVYGTFYVPVWALLVMVVLALGCAVLGRLGSPEHRSS
ncbi:hypothetical protein Q9290_00880 [Oceanimonas sp. CHS3-5]|uniref:DUF2231 domain-containing protein n=1 Tax=Oceanimonas sp. CHS3-5 TaxID=3068186 RepID=UPI00273F037C|nr:DUF2231 domain-containing protein [Oceanimonas sp. CHS3-5]MDP5290854.1 hypothetical protein [Oceanimonas sp. CHS3-5]